MCMFVSGTWKNPKSYWVTATRAKRYAVVEDCQIACLCVWTILAIGGVRLFTDQNLYSLSLSLIQKISNPNFYVFFNDLSNLYSLSLAQNLRMDDDDDEIESLCV